MWLSLNIISQMVDLSGISPEELALKLTMSTAEIDSIERLNHHYKTIFTAKAVEVKPHPNADKLTLVDIDTGKERIKVVCGATNHKSGDIVALATVGTKFSEDFIIQKTKIRGEESSGMLCSLKELGLTEESSGILLFPEGTSIGTPLSEIYPERVDVKLEIDNKSITHRPDLWSHAGFAREIAALYGRQFRQPVDTGIVKSFTNKDELRVTIKNPEGCMRYTGLAVKNIKIAESPEWLKAKVAALGMRPISNIVDITNYVMAEIGEPMHAFDRKKLNGNEIIVRYATAGEKLKTLDNREHSLVEEDIVIADKGGAIALAGVMGGGNSEVDESTTEIVLEAACFNPVNIRKTAARYGLRTEAAIRFEKSLSPEITGSAIARCYQLIKEIIPGAEAVTTLIDTYPVKQKDAFVEIECGHIRKKLGEDIPDEKIVSILEALDFKIENSSGKLKVKVPFYRATKDISIAADIVEEIGRIYGYDNISPQPPLVTCSTPLINDFRKFERNVKNILSFEYGMIETSGYSFTGEDILNKLGINHDRELRLKNPLSQEHDRLRRTIVPNIIKNIELNQRYNDSFAVYELGRVYLKDNRKSEELISENFRTAGAVFAKKPAEALFYSAKKIVSGLMERIAVKEFEFMAEDKNLPPFAHPKRSMLVKADGKICGMIFELHPKTKTDFDINGQAVLFDIDLDILFSSEKKGMKFSELQKFPEVPFELSAIAGSHVFAGDILKEAMSADKQLIQSGEIVTVYEGEPVPAGKKSVSMKLVFASNEKTLSTDEIDSLQKKIIAHLEKKGYPLR